MKVIYFTFFVSLLFVSCNDNSTKAKELELKEKELDLKERELNLKDSIKNEKGNSLYESIKKGLHPSVSELDQNVLIGKSKKLLVRVDRTKQGLRYTCWRNNKTYSDIPDIVLLNGVEEKQGTIGGWTWTFKNEGWTYLVNDAQVCETPSGCGLYLELYYNDELKSKTKLTPIN